MYLCIFFDKESQREEVIDICHMSIIYDYMAL